MRGLSSECSVLVLPHSLILLPPSPPCHPQGPESVHMQTPRDRKGPLSGLPAVATRPPQPRQAQSNQPRIFPLLPATLKHLGGFLKAPILILSSDTLEVTMTKQMEKFNSQTIKTIISRVSNERRF